MGDLKGASETLEKASKIYLNVLGDTKDAAYCFLTYGEVLSEKGNYNCVLEPLKKATEIMLNVFGCHKDTAWSFHLLGVAQFHLKDFRGALESFKQASKMNQDLFGAHNPATVASLQCLNEVKKALNLESQ